MLVVDDGDTNRKLIRLILERSGAKVRLAEDGQVAVDMAAHTQFDVILIDMQMPVLDGYSATARLRERGFAGPIIALTAHALQGDREKCERAGCSGYLSKPIDLDELHETLDRIASTAPSHRAPASVAEQRSVSQLTGPPIRSLLPTDDAEIREIVEEFLDTLETKIAEMERAWDEGDVDALTQLAHWLKERRAALGSAASSRQHPNSSDLCKTESRPAASEPLKTICELKRRLVL